MTIKMPEAPVIFLMGPTASGKTALAIDLYQTHQFELISVDSAMVYTHLNIGSAKPTAKELEQAPHHLIDFVDPAQSYSASQFSTDAKTLINQIHAKGKVPILVGGTMLYFKALRDGLADLPQAEPVVRDALQKELEAKGIEHLHRELSLFDAKTAERLHTNDTQRILRAIEVYRISEKPISVWHAEQALDALPNPLLSIALAPQDRAILHQRIEQRFQLMMKQGFLAEVTALFKREDLSLQCPAIKSVGYRQVWQHLMGEMSLDEAVERAIIATRQLAKRQYTWLRSWPDVQWFDPLQEEQKEKARKAIIEFVNH
ncbi:tRNA (adenosine(37)-N6)-dimethylallyltransferase MiaA [Aliikangiella sp. IMCC44359]|uniref:tRNA (adenosine(37)-N6)-dimethylallyltransferase MiaA n=1 Tax=Aliikangiella sp. IMCC44359 TaxID=3459125 RepID=UPI00403ADA2E